VRINFDISAWTTRSKRTAARAPKGPSSASDHRRNAGHAAPGWLRLGALAGCLAGLLFLLAGATSAKAGAQAPDFQLKDLHGKVVRLSDLRGKPVVLHFWATWCPHCLREMPLLEQSGHDLAARGIRVLAINLGEPRGKVERYVADQRLHLEILLDSRGKAAQAFGVVGLPATVVLDSEGRVAGQIDMGALTHESIDRLVAGDTTGISP